MERRRTTGVCRRWLVACLAAWLSWGAWADTDVLTVGVVPQYPAQRIQAIWQPLLDALAERVPARFRLDVREDIPAFEAALAEGAFQIAYANPSQYRAVRGRYRPILRDHGRKLQGILVVPRANGAQSLEDLRDRRLVFPQGAYAACELMIATLRREGLRFTPVFVPDHDSVYLNVLLGLYPAGGGVQSTLDRQPEGVRRRLRVLYRTATVPPHPIVVDRRLPEGLAGRIQAALLALSAERPELFSGIPMRRPGQAGEADYQGLPGAGE